MESKKINQLATEMSPAATDLTIIGDPITGVSKKVTLEQISSLFSGLVSFYANYAAFPATGAIDTIYCAKDTSKLYLWSGSAYVEVFPSQALLNTYQLRSEKGNANGYASLDSLGKVPISQLPSSLMEYKGTWNASTNTPTLANGTGDTGDVYICSVAGSVNFGAGSITFAVGDYVIYSGTIWQRSSGAVGTVTSVAVTESVAALSITGSPITTSGTINIGFAGASTEYVAGDGSLVTFPTLTGYVPYMGATSAIDLNAKTVVNISHLGINTTSVPTILLRAIGDNNSSSRIAMRGYSSDANSSSIRVTKFRGTTGAPQAPQSGDSLGKFELAGYGTTASDGYPQASFEGLATENWGATARGSKTVIKVTPNTTITQAVALTINQDKSAVFENSITGTSIIKTGGTSSQFLKADGSVDSSTYISLTALSATSPLSYNNTTGAFTISQATTSTNGYLSSTDWNTFNSKGIGSVTSVALSAPTGFSVTGSPITTTGTLALAFATGYSLPTNASQTNWDTAYTNRITSATSPLSITSNAISISQASGSTNGYLSSTDWTTFNNKQSALTNPVTGTGTSGQVTYFNGTSSVTGSNNFKFDGTNLTVGNPTSALAQWHVYNASGAATMLLQTNSTTDYSEIAVRNNSSTATSYFRQYSTAATGSDFGISRAGLALFFSNYATNFAIGTRNGGDLILGTNDVERARMFSATGNLSLNSSSDAGYKLDVNGTGRFSGAVTGTSFESKRNGSASISSQFQLSSISGTTYSANIQLGSTGSMDFWTYDAASLGWGKYLSIASTGAATFSNTLSASGNISSSGSVSSNIGASNAVGTGSYLALMNPSNLYQIVIQLNASYGLDFWSYQGVSFGKISNINETTGVYTPLSDINKKKDFEDSTIGLNAILGLKPTLYRMKSDDTEGNKELGFIAQEVNEFIPQAFVESGDEDNKFIGLNYNAITATLVKAIQELEARLKTIENK
jgi:hypothetical protein